MPLLFWAECRMRRMEGEKNPRVPTFEKAAEKEGGI